MTEARTIHACRSCGDHKLTLILDLGLQPLADRLVDPDKADEAEPRYPLRMALCGACGLVQLLEVPAPEALFDYDYPYYSSWSDSYLEHCHSHAETLIRDLELGPGSRVLEIASNDGYMLQFFAEHRIPVLGIDPAPGPAAVARQRGIETREAFFDAALARGLRNEGLRADLILANNVLAHVPDPNEMLRGIAELMAPDGLCVIEVPYVRDLVERAEFDTVYHEHHCYFSLGALSRLAEQNGLGIARAERLSVHGGSLRVHLVARASAVRETVSALLEEERQIGLARLHWYAPLAQRIAKLTEALRAFVDELREQGATLAAYGAAAKGAMLLNRCGLDARSVEFVVDRNPAKQGRLMPGVGIPILAPEALLERRPDYTLILPWNLADEIIGQQRPYLAAGGQFIIPIPEPRIVDRPDNGS